MDTQEIVYEWSTMIFPGIILDSITLKTRASCSPESSWFLVFKLVVKALFKDIEGAGFLLLLFTIFCLLVLVDVISLENHEV